MKKGLIISSVIVGLLLISAGCKRTTTSVKKTTANNITQTTTAKTTAKNVTTKKRVTTKKTTAKVTTTEQIKVDFKTIYVSNEGLTENDGIDAENPTTLEHALELYEMYDEIHFLSGIYEFDGSLEFKISGDKNKKCVIKGIDDVTFDFKKAGSGIIINASYITIDNINVKNSNDYGFTINGNYVTVTNCISEENDGGGYSIAKAANNNTISKSLARYNYYEGVGVNGFYISSSGINNKLEECVSYRNQDNGYKIISTQKVVVKNSLAYENGINKDGSVNTLDGDRAGFYFNLAAHEFINCISYANQHAGFKSSDSTLLNSIAFILNNCSSINNRSYNYYLQATSTTKNTGKLNNSLSYNNLDLSSVRPDAISAEVTNSLLFYNKEYYYIDKDLEFVIKKLFNYDAIDLSSYKDENEFLIHTEIPDGMKKYNEEEIKAIEEQNELDGIEQTREEIIASHTISYEINFYFHDNLYLYGMLNRCEDFQSLFFITEEISEPTFFGANITPIK